MRKIISIILTLVFSAFSIYAYAGTTVTVTDMTDSEWAESGIAFIDINSNAMIKDGAIRYLNTDNLLLTPRLVNSRTYFPAEALAEALDLYIEKNDLKGYILIRKAEKELKFYIENTKADSEDISVYGMYINGVAYLPLRYTAEFFGNTVIYSDGYILIGEEARVNNILENGTYFSYMKNKLTDFKPEMNSGKTYYVSALNGSNLNDGSEEKPYKTIAKASTKVNPGDTVIIREGTYRETLKLSQNGTASQPITYKAYPGEKVVISALKEVSGFSETDKENIVSAETTIDLGRGRNQVFYNGEAAVEARYPNHSADEYGTMNLNPLFPTKGDIKVVSVDREAGTSVAQSDTLLSQEAGYWNGATYVSLHYAGWNVGTATIESSETGKLNLTNLSKQWWFNVNSTYEDSANYGFISGHENAIDISGEWVISDGNLKIYLPENETAETLKVEVKERQLVIDIADNKYIRIEGIETVGGGVKMNNSEMCVIDNCTFRYVSHYVDTQDQREGFIDDCNALREDAAPRRGEMGIYDGGKNNVFINNRIDVSAAAGLYLTGLFTKVENNEISNCGYMGSSVAGIYIGSDAYNTSYNAKRGGYKIYHNDVYNCGRAALCVQPYEPWAQTNKQAVYLPCDIAYNKFHDSALNARDTGIVYMWGATMGNSLKKTQLHNNLVYQSTDAYYDLTAGIYYDNYMNTVDNYDNIVFYTSKRESGLHTMNYDVFIQDGSSDDSTNAQDINSYNNTYLKEISLVELTEENYPYSKVFIAGVKGENETVEDVSQY